MPPQKLKIGVAGLGRMGKRHALNFFQSVPRAELVAVSTPDAQEREWAEEHLAPSGVRVYDDYDDMLKQNGLEAVCIASATAVHAPQAIAAIAAGKHILCEKPLATSAEVVSTRLFYSLQGPKEHTRIQQDGANGFSRKQLLTPPPAGPTSKSCAASPGDSTTATATPMPR